MTRSLQLYCVHVTAFSQTDLFLDIFGIVGDKASKVLKKMQRSIISSSLNIARTFKVLN